MPDPTDPQLLNRYSYCRNNPLMYVDPSGHFPHFIVGALISGSSSPAYSQIRILDRWWQVPLSAASRPEFTQVPKAQPPPPWRA
ncbi:hypothetical protein TRIP_B40244 [uncultured Desulfatiglans sp.]|uniref:RHS repeat-associated core domain-containing protein n=1 Tax=Uncultured Desulfatiglans sp. TaxID=1748965 RepID=A0A653AE66_UNCDX|nr:hypothetical protein TRIP_B40244 [uncultured Desulfatiglans sp.]